MTPPSAAWHPQACCYDGLCILSTSELLPSLAKACLQAQRGAEGDAYRTQSAAKLSAECAPMLTPPSVNDSRLLTPPSVNDSRLIRLYKECNGASAIDTTSTQYQSQLQRRHQVQTLTPSNHALLGVRLTNCYPLAACWLSERGGHVKPWQS